VIVHLSDIGEVETLEISNDNITITLQYKTRADAELASTKGLFFRGKKLIIVWVRDCKDEDSEKILDPESQARALDDELLASRLAQANVDTIDLDFDDNSEENQKSNNLNEDLLNTEQVKMEEDTLDSNFSVEGRVTDVPKSETNSNSRNVSKGNDDDDLLYEDDHVAQKEEDVIDDEDALLDEEL